MSQPSPWALRWCRDRPEVWGAVGAGSLATALATLSLGPQYGFAAFLFLFGAVVSLARTAEILRDDAVDAGSVEPAGSDVACRDD